MQLASKNFQIFNKLDADFIYIMKYLLLYSKYLIHIKIQKYYNFIYEILDLLQYLFTLILE